MNSTAWRECTRSSTLGSTADVTRFSYALASYSQKLKQQHSGTWDRHLTQKSDMLQHIHIPMYYAYAISSKCTFSLYDSSYSSGAMNSGVPSTLIVLSVRVLLVDRPRSPILMSPVWPLMKMLSHLRSL
eukprot:14829-Heterococcus_DN1.PRE.1